jgi:hypothetical protein
MQPLAGLFLDWSVGHTVPGRVEEKVNEKGERQNERKPKAAYAVLPSL